MTIKQQRELKSQMYKLWVKHTKNKQRVEEVTEELRKAKEKKARPMNAEDFNKALISDEIKAECVKAKKLFKESENESKIYF